MTVGNVGLYARTLAYLRADQVAHALYRRVVPRSRPRAASDAPRPRPRIGMREAPQSNRAFGGARAVDELARGTGVDWACPHAARLWRYHVHYFDFLGDPERSAAWKRAIVADWIARNPPETPDAWDPYPLSLRIVNWIKWFDRDGAEAGALRSCYEQTLWLERNLERRVLANHYLKNAKALFFAGLFFAGADAERWLAVGSRILLAEVAEQFLADGAHYERSPMYHAIGVADLLDAVNLAASAPGTVPVATTATLRACARRGLDYFDALLMPDGEIPLFNDAAFGVGPEPAELFAYAAEILTYRRAKPPTTLTTRAFAASGYYVIRDGADAIVIDCGDPGPAYQPGHGHADCLSYELALGGRRVVVDSGVFDYEAGATRAYARSTAAHNTITVDDCDQSELWGTFRMARRARPLAAKLAAPDGREACFVGAHDGFSNGRGRIVHRRTIRHLGRYWSFEDAVLGGGTHRIDDRIHLAPGLRARAAGDGIDVRDADGRPVARVTSAGLATRIDAADYYPRFGESQRIDVIVFSVVTALPAETAYTIERL